MNGNILIASSSIDEHAFRPVSEILRGSGFSVVIYLSDKVLEGKEHLNVSLQTDGTLEIAYNGHAISPGKVDAAWYRKIGGFSRISTATDLAKQQYINNEVKLFHDTIWASYPENIWLNSPENIRRAERKIGQLTLAQKLGFNVPKTIISSDWEFIKGELFNESPEIIVKMLRGVIGEDNKTKALYTTRLDSDNTNELANTTIPFPGIYQPYIAKSREWRVTVVGENVFSAAILTTAAAKDDWRKLQATSAVEFKAGNLPDDVTEKCTKFLGSMGLKYGAFDFVETPDGEMIFLECNPNGQYGWLEEELGFPISNAIATELINIAKTS